jgi:hypothetical protein
MTVWAKLQSWLGASASDVAIDNEFNNIYLGLNEAANGNLPSGYNKVGLTFTGASLTIKGETKIGNTNVPLDSALTVSGLAGWRYIVTTNGGVMSVESIPGAEITADTQVYTPTPVFNVANNGYYSTVNTARRIVGICYFDATNIKEVIAYGHGRKRNDDFWMNSVTGAAIANTIGQRLQFTSAMRYSRGSNITIVDNGAGSTDAEGVRVTNLSQSEITISGSVDIYSISTVASGGVSVYKNGVLFIGNIVLCAIIGSGASINSPFSFTDKHSQKDDYYTFVVSDAINAGVGLYNIRACK